MGRNRDRVEVFSFHEEIDAGGCIGNLGVLAVRRLVEKPVRFDAPLEQDGDEPRLRVRGQCKETEEKEKGLHGLSRILQEARSGTGRGRNAPR